eukprot:CAMPEP_0116885558 /NCGR_PEP_ID=MMETSP0463-20121206/19000_1 /TAXON_ID=181622 /ORGANISM="Strombidinopsis sp, Strain SopsisLIS2011" /LENGTH=189 /DNA_ID=CAMNT_0004544283 /DNA_START=138 /DNA_END=707 /DNA_ORIENTATION=+
MEVDLVGGQSSIQVGHSSESVLGDFLVKRVEVDLLVSSSFKADTSSSTSHMGWSSDILQNRVVNVSQSSASWSHLAGMVLSSLGDDGSVGNDHDCASEFGFEVLNNLVTDGFVKGIGSVRNSDVVVFAHGSVGLLEFNFFSRVDQNKATLFLQFNVTLLKVHQTLGHSLFQFGNLGVVLLDNFALVKHL